VRGIDRAETPAEYIASLEEPRRSDVAALDRPIREASGLDPAMAHGLIAYGQYHYKYASGREGDWYVIGLASLKRYISLYVTAADGDGYVAERYRERLPKADIGKSCIRVKRLSDVDEGVLRKVVAEGVRVMREQAASGDGRIRKS